MQRLTQKQRLIALILAGGVILLIVAMIISFFSRQPASTSPTSEVVIIDNRGDYSGVSQEAWDSIGTTTYAAVRTNKIDGLESVYHGTIRKNTFSLSDSRVASFILDIPSLQLSWQVAQGLTEEKLPFSDASVLCITEDKAVYPITKTCIDISSGGFTAEQQKQLAISSILPLQGPTYRIVLQPSTTKEGSYALAITTYSVAGRQDALQALRALEYKPEDYEIVYIDK